MIIGVKNGERLPIAGVAREAGIQRRGTTAIVTVLRDSLIATPRPHETYHLGGDAYRLARILERSSTILRFEMERQQNG